MSLVNNMFNDEIYASLWAVVSQHALAFGNKTGEFDYFYTLISLIIVKIARWYRTFRLDVIHYIYKKVLCQKLRDTLYTDILDILYNIIISLLLLLYIIVILSFITLSLYYIIYLSNCFCNKVCPILNLLHFINLMKKCVDKIIIK